ncbi:MAG: hypothetical protein WC969_03085 [Elusimicrobiota bacterium]|jgi:hypothetical protein
MPRERSDLHLTVCDRHSPPSDLAYWLAQTPEARLEAVEFLRGQCFLAMGLTQTPRLVREIRIVERPA